MPPKKTILLSREQALESICFDFRQYGVQVMLFCEILRLISRGMIAVKKASGKEGIWISTPARRHMQWFDGNELIEYMCKTITSAALDPETLAAVCARVFQTRAIPETDPHTGETGVRIDTGMESFRCRQCGQCCKFLDYHNEVSTEDIRRWEKRGRFDILKWVGRMRNADGKDIFQIWVIPGTRQLAEVCPFLHKMPTENRSICRIHDEKPFICRNYPVSCKHARMTGCPGFDR